MSRTKYSRYTPDPFDDLSMSDLIDELSDYLLQSGFADPFGFTELSDHTMQALREAVLRALLREGKLTREDIDRLMGDAENFEDSELREFLDRLIQRMQDEGYIRVSEPNPDLTAAGDPEANELGDVSPPRSGPRFELTDKSIDFLGFKSLRGLLGGLGKASFGQHETKELATGVEIVGSSKPYEFGDTLNLDVGATLLSAVSRNGLGVPVDLAYQDLHVHQSEYRSSCATVLMLDCSHSMILYGEDRFTPAKRVTLALAHLIRTQFPGDNLHLVLFHDSAEEVPMARLASVRVGPFHTNTAEGLRLAQEILLRDRSDMRQIIMITDGKPSALTLEDGRIYKNPFGLDPLILDQTFKQVVECRRKGILINTFMLARDYSLVGFVKKVTEIVKGKAYFTTPASLGQYVLMDYVNKKMKTVH
ncbi:MAG TPA: VWA domain-containing protein [Vicinamibacteria bacterium]|nr:VWA domain-containing protein [Vicinamibacteria bacterium]